MSPKVFFHKNDIAFFPEHKRRKVPSQCGGGGVEERDHGGLQDGFGGLHQLHHHLRPSPAGQDPSQE